MTVLTRALRRLEQAPAPALETASAADPAILSFQPADASWEPIDAVAPSATDAAQEPTAADDPPADTDSPRLGEVLLAVDLTGNHERGHGLAAALAIEGGASSAVVSVASGSRPADEDDAFTTDAASGLSTRGYGLGSERSAGRRLLVLADDCRQRFARTVLLVAADDAAAWRAAAPRVDGVLLLGASGRTPESRLLKAEATVRRHAPHARPRVVLAA